MFIILFGLSGSGKNYVGEILKTRFNYYFWDADTVLTDEMRVCIEKKCLFTQAMRDSYFEIVVGKIKDLRNIHKNLVVAQGLYKNRNRLQILSAFPDVTFIQVESNKNLILQRLKRGNNLIDDKYADVISKNFELPTMPVKVIYNNNDEAGIVKQLE